MIQRKSCIYQKITEAIIMDMYNNFKLNEDFVVDIELLRMEILIERREAYEEEFFSMEPPAVEVEYSVAEYGQQFIRPEIEFPADAFEEDVSNPFELEDHLNQMRDEALIRQRIEYESYYLNDPLASKDFYDYQIESLEDGEFIGIEEYDYVHEDPEEYIYDEYEEEMFYHLLYLRESQFRKQNSCSCTYIDYMPNDDGFCDYLECYDYPEGPDENLAGVKFY